MQRPFKLVMCLLTAGVIAVRPSLAEEPSEEQLAQLYAGVAELQGRIELHDAASPTRTTDAAVFAKAIDTMLRLKEFGRKPAVRQAFQTLEWGQERAEQLGGTESLSAGCHILGYESRLDGSLQPYAVTLPPGWNDDGERRWPLHVVLHGRSDAMNEVAFIAQHEGKPPLRDANWIQIDVYGRGNNAYRWCGEVDVFEALADAVHRFSIDERRITLWGFSMGGAGAWHLGLHHPDRWSSVGAGAGFVDFYNYQKKLTPLPDYQDRTLRIYDTVNYALNLADVPFITYGGENDPQLAASKTMAEEARKLDVPLRMLVGKNMGHKFDDVSLKQFMAFHAAATETGRPEPPGRRDLRFVTFTLKYNRCDWLRIEEQIAPYERTTVESTTDDGRLNLKTENVRALAIARTAARAVSLDGSEAMEIPESPETSDVYFVREGDQWRRLDDAAAVEFVANPDLHKRHDLQGPIDDAFMAPFICVRGTSGPWAKSHQAWADWTLERFGKEWDRWSRGRIRTVDDSQISEADLRDSNLILFGDPGSNSILRSVVEKLPLKWSESEIVVNGKTYDAASHGVAMIYPNPLNPRRYVVINSGMTMHEEDFKNSNAWLFPKLGDVAVIKFTPAAEGAFKEETVWADLFDGEWKLGRAPSGRG